MDNTTSSTDDSKDDKKFLVWKSLLKTSLSLPNSKIDRHSFLQKQLRSHFRPEIVSKAIETSPANAGISKEKVDEIAKGCIGKHVLEVSAISFAAGLPGGWWMAGTIPVDLAQFYWHSIVLAQKLAYLYGWPELFDTDNNNKVNIDDETILRLTLFVGIMMGTQTANKVVADIAKQVATESVKRIPRIALTQYGWYNLAKQVGKWIGVSITKQSFARIVSKIIPLFGGLLSAGISAAMMIPMANRLKDHLRELEFAQNSESVVEVEDDELDLEPV